MSLSFEVSELDPSTDLLDELVADSWVWLVGGGGIVANGVAASFDPGKGSERFARASQWIEDTVGVFPNQDHAGVPLAFASFTFDPSAEGSLMVIPQRLVMKREGVCRLIEIAGSDSQPEWLSGQTDTFPGDTDDDWLQKVELALERLVRGELNKVVIARSERVDREDLDVAKVVSNLATEYPSCYVFSVAGLVGASPELLVRTEQGGFVSRPVAGTVEHSQIGELMKSRLLLAEHRITVRSVQDALAESALDMSVAGPRPMSFGEIAHLVSDVSGRIQGDLGVLDLVGILHPTAAVCGDPSEEAMRMINEVEPHGRGRYSGPVGWVGFDGDGEFAVAIRCAQFSPGAARLFAGNGIVWGARAQEELAEVRLKFEPMMEAMGITEL